jgi:hypothetical protein
MKMNRKNIFRRVRANNSLGLRKFMVPPAVLIFRELRRLELMERQPPMAALAHHVD